MLDKLNMRGVTSKWYVLRRYGQDELDEEEAREPAEEAPEELPAVELPPTPEEIEVPPETIPEPEAALPAEPRSFFVGGNAHKILSAFEELGQDTLQWRDLRTYLYGSESYQPGMAFNTLLKDLSRWGHLERGDRGEYSITDKGRAVLEQLNAPPVKEILIRPNSASHAILTLSAGVGEYGITVRDLIEDAFISGVWSESTIKQSVGRLMSNGAIERVKRGSYKITDAGRAALEALPELDRETLEASIVRPSVDTDQEFLNTFEEQAGKMSASSTYILADPKIIKMVDRILPSMESIFTGEPTDKFAEQIREALESRTFISRDRLIKYLKQLNAYNPHFEELMSEAEYQTADHLHDFMERLRRGRWSYDRYHRLGAKFKPFDHRVSFHVRENLVDTSIPSRNMVTIVLRLPTSEHYMRLPPGIPVEAVEKVFSHVENSIGWARFTPITFTSKAEGQKSAFVVEELQADIISKAKKADLEPAVVDKIRRYYIGWYKVLMNWVLRIAKQYEVDYVLMPNADQMVEKWSTALEVQRDWSEERKENYKRAWHRIYDQNAYEYGGAEGKLPADFTLEADSENQKYPTKDFIFIPVEGVGPDKIAQTNVPDTPEYWASHGVQVIKAYIWENRRLNPKETWKSDEFMLEEETEWAQMGFEWWWYMYLPDKYKHDEAFLDILEAELRLNEIYIEPIPRGGPDKDEWEDTWDDQPEDLPPPEPISSERHRKVFSLNLRN